jgi:hypothetical protein
LVAIAGLVTSSTRRLRRIGVTVDCSVSVSDQRLEENEHTKMDNSIRPAGPGYGRQYRVIKGRGAQLTRIAANLSRAAIRNAKESRYPSTKRVCEWVSWASDCQSRCDVKWPGYHFCKSLMGGGGTVGQIQTNKSFHGLADGATRSNAVALINCIYPLLYANKCQPPIFA